MNAASSSTLFQALAGDLQGWAVAIWGDRSSAQAALAGAPDDRRHLWLMVWAQLTHRSERVDQPTNFVLWRRRLAGSSVRVIARHAGFGDSQGLRRCLKRLGWRAFSESASYIALLDVLSGPPDLRKALFHAQTVDERTVSVLRALDPLLRINGVIQTFLNDRRHTLSEIRRFCWRVGRVRRRDPAMADRIVDAVARGTNPASDPLWLEAGFPAPPWMGTELLRPLTSPDMITDAGADFSNCLTHWSASVRDGKTYFYRLGDVALIELVAIRGVGWEIFQAYGPRNRTLEEPDRTRLRRELACAPDFICPEIPDYGDQRRYA